MKRQIAIGMLVFITFFLVGCATLKGNPYPCADLTEETWFHYINTSPNAWSRGADRWFLTGDPNVTEESNIAAPPSSAISTMMVKVLDFHNIRVDGPFQVQIFGTYEQNSVYLYGPNEQVRQVAIDVRGDTLYLHKADKADGRLGCVIIRIGVCNLHKLSQFGSGRIEGRQIRSTGLDIESSGSGNIYLAGNVNLRSVRQSGSGMISVFGAVTPQLDITTTDLGGVNVSGNLGLHNINHRGRNDINIMGATGGEARICTSGKGKIGIVGNVNIREINATDETCVYAYCVNSNSLNAYLAGKAKVGLAGQARDLYVNASDYSLFAGRDLMVESAYVRAYDHAHINVTARGKIYTASTGSASVYFFGSPNLMSQFLSGSGTVIPIWGDRPGHFPLCANMCRNYQPYYKDCAQPVRVRKHAVVRHTSKKHYRERC